MRAAATERNNRSFPSTFSRSPLTQSRLQELIPAFLHLTSDEPADRSPSSVPCGSRTGGVGSAPPRPGPPARPPAAGEAPVPGEALAPRSGLPAPSPSPPAPRSRRRAPRGGGRARPRAARRTHRPQADAETPPERGASRNSAASAPCAPPSWASGLAALASSRQRQGIAREDNAPTT